MTSIDELFKGVSSTSGKRKFDARTRDASEVYKAAKLNINGDARSTTHQATAEDDILDDDEEA